MDHPQSDFDVIENATQRLVLSVLFYRPVLRRASVNKLRCVPILMNYNAFNGGGEFSQGDGRNCCVVKIFSCKTKVRLLR